MGLYRSKRISDQYQIHGPDDKDAIEAVNLWLAMSGKQSHSTDALLNALGGYGSADWAKYEKDAKSLYAHIIRTELLESVANYSRKLLKSLRDTRASLATVIQLQVNTSDKRKELHPHPFRWNFLLLAILPSLIICGSSRDSFLLLVSIGVLYFFALIPSIAFYESFLTQSGASLLIRLFSYVALVRVGLLVIDSFRAVWRGESKCSGSVGGNGDSGLNERSGICVAAYGRLLLATALLCLFSYYFFPSPRLI